MATERERAQALGLVLNAAASDGAEAALAKFGGALNDTERALIRDLSADELSALAKVQGKLNLGGLAAMDNNNL